MSHAYQAFVQVSTNEVIQRLDHISAVDIVVVRCHSLLCVSSVYCMGERNNSSATTSDC